LSPRFNAASHGPCIRGPADHRFHCSDRARQERPPARVRLPHPARFDSGQTRVVPGQRRTAQRLGKRARYANHVGPSTHVAIRKQKIDQHPGLDSVERAGLLLDGPDRIDCTVLFRARRRQVLLDRGGVFDPLAKNIGLDVLDVRETFDQLVNGTVDCVLA